ncbi:MAG: AlpA family phage regulatory protein [Hyphomicrobiaceae bacterium]|nr:AlpA family phage regulatory protein [Hyphomicrobiaceae bacterium]
MTTDIIDTKTSNKRNTAQSPLAAPVQSASSPTSSPPSPPRKPRKLICLKEVAYRLSISRATVYRLKDRSLAGKGTFPLPVEIGPGRIGWHEHEIDAWLDALPRIKGA